MLGVDLLLNLFKLDSIFYLGLLHVSLLLICFLGIIFTFFIYSELDETENLENNKFNIYCILYVIVIFVCSYSLFYIILDLICSFINKFTYIKGLSIIFCDIILFTFLLRSFIIINNNEKFKNEKGKNNKSKSNKILKTKKDKYNAILFAIIILAGILSIAAYKSEDKINKKLEDVSYIQFKVIDIDDNVKYSKCLLKKDISNLKIESEKTYFEYNGKKYKLMFFGLNTKVKDYKIIYEYIYKDSNLSLIKDFLE